MLEQADAHVGEDGIVVCRKDKDSFLMRIAVDEKNLEEIELDLEHVKNPEHREMVTELVETYQPQKTKTTDIQMRIILNNEGPVYKRPRRLSEPERNQVEKQIAEWLSDDIIRPSTSDFASPTVLVKKKDGAIRICCDYRRLNKNVIKDRFPLLLIEDVIDKLESAQVFTTIDLKNGFFFMYQLKKIA